MESSFPNSRDRIDFEQTGIVRSATIASVSKAYSSMVGPMHLKKSEKHESVTEGYLKKIRTIL